MYITTLNNVYSVARRFGSFYNNTETVALNKGTYVFNGVSVVVKTATNAKILSTGITKLRSKINQLTNNNIWTVAVFETASDYSHFDPLRPAYLKGYDKTAINTIVKNEDLMDTYR